MKLRALQKHLRRALAKSDIYLWGKRRKYVADMKELTEKFS